MSGFIFATGIENSYPIVGSGQRVDEMEKCGHYARWREDLKLTKEFGIDHLRIGPAYYRMHEAPGRYRWDLFDEVAEEMGRLGIEPIVDLLHFGLPEWMGNFQNPQFPALFSEYAGDFARRYPHVRMYTPINEILITARFSAKFGWWNERLTSDRAYVTALKNLVKANVLAMSAIRRVRPDAVFIQTESFECWHAEDPAAQDRVDLENELRFVPLDLTYGVRPGPLAMSYLRNNGLSRDDVEFISARAMVEGCVIGIDYYVTSEHTVRGDGTEAPAVDTMGLVEICREYYDRYSLPMMHTETNMTSDGAVAWLRKQWMSILRLIGAGVPITGFTWFSLIDQIDWDTALREVNGRICPVGLADMDRNPRPVGHYYRDLIRAWKGRLPMAAVAAPSRECIVG